MSHAGLQDALIIFELVFNNGRIAVTLYYKSPPLFSKWSHLEQIYLPVSSNWNLSIEPRPGKIHLRQNSPINEILSQNFRWVTRLEGTVFRSHYRQAWKLIYCVYELKCLRKFGLWQKLPEDFWSEWFFLRLTCFLLEMWQLIVGKKGCSYCPIQMNEMVTCCAETKDTNIPNVY